MLKKGQWSKEKAWEWYNSRAWIRGFNYMPSNCVTLCDLWQELGWEENLEVIKREIAKAKELGFNSVRVGVCWEVYKEQKEGMFKRMDEFLSVLGENGFTAMFRFGNDCNVRKDIYEPFKVGQRTIPAPGVHGGIIRSPHTGDPVMGFNPLDDEEIREIFYEMVKDVIERYKNDERVVIWNIWNEAGNSRRYDESKPYIDKCFEIAREIAPIQPLTADAWTFTFNSDLDIDGKLRDIEKYVIEISDIVSFHHYGSTGDVVNTIKYLEKTGRPLVNTEWLHRNFNNTIKEIYPLFYSNNIGSYHWGLFAGAAQYYEPWDSIRNRKDINLDLWQHDILRENGRPYNTQEIELIKKINAIADREFENRK